jgi:hypothetical protein
MLLSAYLLLTQSHILSVLFGDCSRLCEKLIFQLWIGLFVVGVFLHLMYYALIFTRESGLWKEIGGNITYRQSFMGDIPRVKWDKRPEPLMKKKTGIIIGISLMIIGSLISIPILTSTLFHFFLNFFIVSTAACILGILLVVFSIVYLGKERNNEDGSLSSGTITIEDNRKY